MDTTTQNPFFLGEETITASWLRTYLDSLVVTHEYQDGLHVLSSTAQNTGDQMQRRSAGRVVLAVLGEPAGGWADRRGYEWIAKEGGVWTVPLTESDYHAGSRAWESAFLGPTTDEARALAGEWIREAINSWLTEVAR